MSDDFSFPLHFRGPLRYDSGGRKPINMSDQRAGSEGAALMSTNVNTGSAWGEAGGQVWGTELGCV